MAYMTPADDSLVGVNSASSHSNQDCVSSPYSSGSTVTVSPSSTSSSSQSISHFDTRCCLCQEIFVNPKVLPCLHIFCQLCLDTTLEYANNSNCPRCQVCSLASKEVSTLLSEVAIKSVVDVLEDRTIHQTSYKSKILNADACSYEGNRSLCPNCVAPHQVTTMASKNIESGSENVRMSPTENGILCSHHKMEAMKILCRTCHVPVCKESTWMEHHGGLHECEDLGEVGPKEVEILKRAIQESKSKAAGIMHMLKTLEYSSGKLQVEYYKAKNEINDTFQFYCSVIEDRKQELLKELDSTFSSKQMSLSVLSQKATENLDKIYNFCESSERLAKHGSAVECLLLKKLIDSTHRGQISFNMDPNIHNLYDLEFVSNYQAIQVGVQNTFGYIRSSSDVNLSPCKQPPISRPINRLDLNDVASNSVNSPPHDVPNGNAAKTSSLNSIFPDQPLANELADSSLRSNIISERFNTANSFAQFSTSSISDHSINGINLCGKCPNEPEILQNVIQDNFSLPLANRGDAQLLPMSHFPVQSKIKRLKMIYHCKFGEFGVLEGQFTEPSGVALNAQNDIIVADSNNHRIQIFDSEGRYKFQFGECGKKDGQFIYPNRVAVVKTSGDIIVTERSPTHQIQIYNQYGQFVRKFGANILQHPRGVTVDNKGIIIVVECKIMRVIFFDQNGSVLHKFGCSKHLEFPNGVAVNNMQEIFISDNRAHSVKVFNYKGVFLRQIGGEGITNYPIGVNINSAGEVLIADNHNNFNLTIFTQDGRLVSALESKVKHAQCFDVALKNDGSIVLASKDYRLYIYRYSLIPPAGI